MVKQKNRRNWFFKGAQPAIIICWLIALMLVPDVSHASGSTNNDLQNQPPGEAIITGQVTDEEGNPLVGATVVIKGTNIGTTTDLDGEFSIEKTGEDVQLIVSYVGYKSQEVAYTGQENVSVQLDPDYYGVEDVVVVGYGVQEKRVVTGSISSVGSEDIDNRAISNTEQALQGKTPGVHVLPTSGSPGAPFKVRVRGAGTNGNANPLYIVDGIKTNDISYLAPQDIESVDVLKDAASAAIYGAEGGNGVVLITTKSGKAGEGQVNYSFQYAQQSPGELPELMNAEQYANYMEEGGLASGFSASEYTGVEGTNWLDEITQTAPMQKHYLSFSGGNEQSTYNASASYLNQDGIVGGDKAKFERFTTRLNVSHDVKDWLNVGANIGYTNTDRASLPEDDEFDGLIYGAILVDPLTPTHYAENNLPSHMQDLLDDGQPLVQDDDGRYFAISENIQGEAVNPLIRMDISKGSTSNNRLLGNTFLNITPIDGLTITSRAGLNYEHQNFHRWSPSYYYSSERNNTVPSVQEDLYTLKRWQMENFITYDISSGNSDFSFVVGNSSENLEYRFQDVTSAPMSFESDLFAEHDYTTNPENDVVDGNLFTEKVLSYFGRASFAFQQKYLFQASLRYDGASTSLLPDGNNWGAFPSFSAGWVLSEESFWQSTAINYLKLRGSWGQNGSLSNLRTVWRDYHQFSPFNGITQYAYSNAVTTQGLVYPDAEGGLLTVAEPSSLPNEDLTWETSQQTDIGFDLRALDNRLTFSTDYYIKETKDLLAIYNAPAAAGNDPTFRNSGDVENKGFEFDLGFRNMDNPFKYGINVNLTTLNNEVTRLDATVPRIVGMRMGTGWREATSFKEGEPIWYFRGYETNGIDPSTGDPVFVDQNDDGNITSEDQTNIGDPHPDLIYGASLNLEYMGFDLNMILQGTQGNDILLGWVNVDRMTSNKHIRWYEDRWTSSNTDASMPRANPDGRTFSSDLMIRDGSYMRIRQIQLGYSLPADLMNTIQFQKARIYVSLDDFFTFTSYEGFDPEAGSEEDASLGIDRGVYPIPRKLMLGLSFTF